MLKINIADVISIAGVMMYENHVIFGRRRFGSTRNNAWDAPDLIAHLIMLDSTT
jgi:hypothetical protein